MATKHRTTIPRATALVMSAAALLYGIAPASATVTPGTKTLTIAAGASATEPVTIDVPAGGSPQADIEFAIDTTGSMASGIAQAKADATAIVTGVQASLPSAQFAVVEFKDSTDSPEYAVRQSMTGSASAVSAAISPMFATGGADNPESQNTVFHNSATPAVGGALGWRTGSRTFVIVLSDSEPHGAGAAGIAGCADTSADPHGLNTATVLNEMKTAQRTLFMLFEPGAATTTLACYQGLAAKAYAGGQGVNGGTSLASTIVSLVGTATRTVNNLHIGVASATPAPAAASWISVNPASYGPLTTPFSVTPDVTVTVPAGTPGGTYHFDLVALADGGDVGHQALDVIVPGGGGGTGGGYHSPFCLDTPPAGAIVGTPGDDTIYGTPGDDVIYGLGGNDRISGLGGNDTICGGDGNDTLYGGAGNDKIDGGRGNDTIEMGIGDDIAYGSSGNDHFWDQGGNDKVYGNEGDDIINGGDGTDLCVGGSGVNVYRNCETVK